MTKTVLIAALAAGSLPATPLQASAPRLALPALSVSTIRPRTAGPNTGFGKAGYDPAKMICVSRSVTGSRLQSVRECHTAQQWEDQKMQEQVGLSRQQINGDPGCSADPAQCGIRNGGKDTPW